MLLVTNITSALGYYFMCFRSVFSRSYVVILVTIGYFFPLSIIAFSYFGIIRYIIGISRHFPTKSQYFSFFKRTNKETVDIFKRVNISNYMQKNLQRQFFLLGDWFFKLVNKLTVSLLTTMLALELVWKLTLEKLKYLNFAF